MTTTTATATPIESKASSAATKTPDANASKNTAKPTAKTTVKTTKANSKATARKEAPATALAAKTSATHTDIPSVELPAFIALTGTALGKSGEAFSAAWAIEQEQQLGLQLLKLVIETIKGVSLPLLSLGLYGGSEAIKATQSDEAKKTRSNRWQKLTGLFNKSNHQD